MEVKEKREVECGVVIRSSLSTLKKSRRSEVTRGRQRDLSRIQSRIHCRVRVEK